MFKNYILAVIVVVIRFLANKVVGPICDFIWRNDELKQCMLRGADSVENKMDENIEYVIYDIKSASSNKNKSYNYSGRHSNRLYNNYDDSISNKIRKWLDGVNQTVFCYMVIFGVILVTAVVAAIMFVVIGII